MLRIMFLFHFIFLPFYPVFFLNYLQKAHGSQSSRFLVSSDSFFSVLPTEFLAPGVLCSRDGILD